MRISENRPEVVYTICTTQPQTSRLSIAMNAEDGWGGMTLNLFLIENDTK